MKVELLNEAAKLPARGTAQSAGIDLYLTEDLELPMGALLVVGVGIAVEFSANQVGLILPRSSATANGVIVHPGVIDSDYRGEIKIAVQSIDGCIIKAGSRVAQLVLLPCSLENVYRVDQLGWTSRSTGE